MSENPVCRRCGYVGPEDAHFCAHCGKALAPRSFQWKASVDSLLHNLSPLHIGLLGLVLSIPIGVIANRLIVKTFSIQFSLVLLAVVVGCGYAYLGWLSHTPRSNRSYLERMLLVFLCMGVSLVVVRLIDSVMLSIVSDSANMVVYEVPGVYIESSPSIRNLSIESNLPPYGLLVMIYGILAAVAGNLVRRARSAAF